MQSAIEAPSDRVEALFKELEGKDISEVVAGGLSKLASVPSGGGVAASSAAPAAGMFATQMLTDLFSFGQVARCMIQQICTFTYKFKGINSMQLSYAIAY